MNLLIFIFEMTDTVFKDLQEKGLQLSQGLEVVLPEKFRPPPTFTYSLPIFGKKLEEFSKHKMPILIKNILDCYFVVGQSNTLLLYKYEIDQNSKPKIVISSEDHLQSQIYEIHTCPLKFAIDSAQIPVLLQHKQSLTLYKLEIKGEKLVYRSELTLPNIKTVLFISDRNILILDNDHFIHALTIKDSKKLEESSSMKFCRDFKEDDKIICSQFIGSVNPEQDSLIKLFFTVLGKDEKTMLKVKEYIHRMDGVLQQIPQTFLITTLPRQNKILNKLKIIEEGQYYIVEIITQILIVKKKFQKYLFMDNLVQKNLKNTLSLSNDQLICSFGDKTFEISFVKLGDPKCTFRLLDEVSYENIAIGSHFKTLWMFSQKKEKTIMFVFEDTATEKLTFYGLIKKQPMKKLLELVQKKKDLVVLQELGLNMGISRKDFYLQVWSHSQKELKNILEYLLPCEDVISIKKELRMLLRRKKINVCDMLNIFQRIKVMIEIQLKTNLDVGLIKEYIKNDFLRKKVKLYNMNQQLDAHILDNIYKSGLIDIFVQIIQDELCPKVKQNDPLHAMAPTEPKDEKNLKHVFQEFKLAILENYRDFLLTLLGHFEDNIAKVIKSFPFLLPKYPFNMEVVVQETTIMAENIDNTLNTSMIGGNSGNIVQYQWFSEINPKSWFRELTKQKIQRHLHHDYSTNLILSEVDKLAQSSYGRENKLKNHCLINCTLSQYKAKVQNLSGIKLYLKVCEFANEAAVKLNKESQSQKLIKIFQTEHKLEGTDLSDCLLYTKMHYFMIKHNILENKKITIEGLIELAQKPQNLVALFFLGNKQKKKYVLNEFLNVYKDNLDEYTKVIAGFIFSQNCSRIELQLLCAEMVQKTQSFQVEKQQIIDLIIQGFCQKLELRETTSTISFLKSIQNLHLKKNLAMKIYQISQLKQCKYVFQHFNWGKKTYSQILADPRTTFANLLESYFHEEMKDNILEIEEQSYDLCHSRNMLNVLLFFRDMVFMDFEVNNVLIVYGQIMIQWRQFDIIKILIHQEKIPELLNLNCQQFQKELLQNCLDAMYREDINFDEETKAQIRNILDIDTEENSPLRVRENAKLRIAEIFANWQFDIKTSDIELIVSQWKNQDRAKLFQDIIKEYIDNLDFETLIQLYQLFEMTEKEVVQIDIKTEQFVGYLLYYCEKLKEKKRHPDIIEILSFLKDLQGVVINFALIADSFLQQICRLYGDNEEIGKNYINFFFLNEDKDQELHRIFDLKLDAEALDGSELDYVTVDQNICFRKSLVLIKSNDLWAIATKEESLTVQEKFYNYFFILMSLKNSKAVLENIKGISYNLQKVFNALLNLQYWSDENSDSWGLQTYQMYKKFLKGLFRFAITKIDDVKKQLEPNQSGPETVQLQSIKALLKSKDKKNNQELLKVISKVESHVESLRSQKAEREKRFLNKMHQDDEERKKNIQVPEIQEKEEQLGEDDIAMKYVDVKKMKEQILGKSAFLTERDIVKQIYDDMNQSRFNNSKIIGGGDYRVSVLGNLSNPRKQVQKEVSEAIEMIQRQEWGDITSKFDMQIIKKAVKSIYEDSQTTFEGNLRIFDCLGLSDQKKIQIGRYVKLFKNNVSESDLKSIFPFEFFVNKLGDNVENQKETIFLQIQKWVSSLISVRRPQQVGNIATLIGQIFENDLYEKRVILKALNNLSDGAFEAENILKIRHYTRQLSKDQFFMQQMLPQTWQLYRKNPQLSSLLRQQILNLPELLLPSIRDILK